MLMEVFKLNRFLPLIAALIIFYFFPTVAGHAQSTKWFLCVPENPELIYFSHHPESSECIHRIAVRQTAYLVGGVNVGLRAKLSRDGIFSEDGRSQIYLPRGTSVIVLDATVDRRTLVYLWDANIFALMSPYSEGADGKRTFAWDQFDEKFENADYAIVLRKTAFISPVLLSVDESEVTPITPSDLLSGRLIKIVGNLLVFDEIRGAEKVQIALGRWSGFALWDDIRIVRRPDLRMHFRYFVGRTAIYQGEIKPCSISQSISTLTERSKEMSLNGGISVEKILELTGKIQEKTLNNRSLKQELPANLHIKTARISALTGNIGEYGFFKIFQPRGPEKKDFNFTQISSCDGKEFQFLISKGSKHWSTDQKIIIRNEEDFEYYKNKLSEERFSDNEIYFILSVAAINPKASGARR